MVMASASILSSRLLCGKNLVVVSSTGRNRPDRMMKRKIPVNNPQHQTLHGQECVLLQGEEADTKMIVACTWKVEENIEKFDFMEFTAR